MPTVKIADSDDKRRWDDYVISQADAGPYHLFAWKEAVESAYGHRAIYLIAQDSSGHIQGVLPLVLVRPPFFRATLVSLPFCDYGGMLVEDDEVKDVLLQTALELSRRHKAQLELRLKTPEIMVQSLPSLSATSHKARMVLDLSGNSENLWDTFKSKLRSQIKRPQKEGLEFVLGSYDLVDDFYKVFSVNMRDLGSPVHSRTWIKAVVHSYADKSHIGIVYAGKLPIAGGIILECNTTVSLPWASALSEYSRSSPNMLLYWGFLKYAGDNGFRHFDFGRSTPGEGTYRFKEQWGALPVPLFWYGEGFSNPSGHDVAGKIRPIIEKTWARIPQKVTDTLGPMVRRFMTL
jgi:FemAB-related protein (PEP-CTERM system-associated)